MTIFGPIILTILLFQASSKASDVIKNVNEVKNIEDGPKLDDAPYGVMENIKTQDKNENNGRQKRYYDYVEFGFPPFLESNFPFPSLFNYNKRDDSQNTGVYGSQDLHYILRYLQRILNDAKRQHSTPKPTRVHIPTYIPIFYLPQAACDCPSNEHQAPEKNDNNKETNNKDVNNNNNNKDVNNNNNNKQQPPPPTIAPSSEVPPTVPDLPNRFPAIDDMRQNWGTVVNDNQSSDVENDDDDGNRPISLDPIELPDLLDIPAPPVEHGSVQVGAEPQTTTVRTVLESDKASSNRRPEIPSLCDAAIVTCCVRKEVTHLCFSQQGCPDASLYGDPCEPEKFRQVLNKVYTYVKQRNG